MKKLNKNSVSLIVTSAINNVIALFVNFFLVAYLLQISSQNITNVGLFYLIAFSMLGIGYFLLSPILEKINKLIIFRIGIVLKLVFVFLVVYLGENIVNYIVLVALFEGVASAFYWSSFNAMRNEIIKHKAFKKFFATNIIVNQFITVLFPFLLGGAIDVSSFGVVSIVVLSLAVVQFTASLFLDNPNPHRGTFDLKGFFIAMKKTQSGDMFRSLYFTYFLGGLRNSVSAMIVFLTVLTFRTNTNLGILTSVFGLFSIFTLLFFSKGYHYQKSRWMILVIAGLVLISIGGLMFEVNRITLIAFNFVNASLVVLPIALLDMRRNTIVKSLHMHEYIVENMSLAEVSLNFGRVFSYLFLIVVGMLASAAAVNVMVLVIGIFLFVFVLSIYLLEVKVNRFETEHDELFNALDIFDIKE